ncbi:IS630 family transposase [Streptosporangium sp. NPDC051022]|uniref:IS630 family transposase n=1 Tax=Streptosporangium sp. NPDC051022 TaxID=3155752 RepID=UPI00342FFA56
MACDKSTRAAWNSWLVFADESGRSLKPPRGRTWARKGQTPVLQVSYGDHGRVSIAALICVKPGERVRLIYRTITYHRRKGEKKGFAAADFADLLQAAHVQLDGPISLVWDSLPEHVSAHMRSWIAAHADWLLVYRLPPYAPDLNPAEGIWSSLRTALLNFAVRGIDELTALIKHRLKRMQYQPELLTGFVAQTGLMVSDPV